jgi:phosphatidylglycerophosphate synthase
MVSHPVPIVPWARVPGALPAAASVAALIAALGWLLMQGADWHFRYIGAALSGYMVLAAGVALAAAWHLRGMGFGVANQVTLLRSGLVCLVGGTLLAGGHAPSASWSLAAIIGLALSLDAVDGWLARRLGLASRFGARFDLEIDALLILILAVLVWQAGRVDGWVLVIGGMRYGFAALGAILPVLRRPLPPSRRRKAVCAMLGVLLLICLLPPTPAWLAGYAAALALAAQLASFGTDIVWLARHAEAMATVPGEPA